MQKIQRFVTVLFLLLAPAAINAAPLLTFESLHEGLSAAQNQQLSSLLEAARRGDLSARISVIRKVQSSAGMAKAAGLIQQMYDEVGLAAEPRYLGQVLESHYGNLAQYYLDPDSSHLDPERGMAILLDLVKHDPGTHGFSLRFQLEGSAVLPETGQLAAAWEQFLETGQEFTLDDLAPSNDPPADLPPNLAFSTCPGVWGQLDEIADDFDESLRQFVRTPQRGDELRAAFNSRLAQAHGSGPMPVVKFNFREIPVLALVAIVLDMKNDHGLSAYHDPELQSVSVGVYSKTAPLMLTAARVLAAHDLKVECADQRIRLVRGKPEAVPRLPIVLADFPIDVRKNPDGTMRLVWPDNNAYEGEIDGILPHGRGVLQISPMRLDGHFQHGLPHGEGLMTDQDGRYRYQGGYRYGLHHGHGKLHDEYEGMFHEGQFEEGRVVGEAELPVGSAKLMADPIQYRGDTRDGLPDGEGTCRFRQTRYRCRFMSGTLVGVGDTLLVP